MWRVKKQILKFISLTKSLACGLTLLKLLEYFILFTRRRERSTAHKHSETQGFNNSILHISLVFTRHIYTQHIIRISAMFVPLIFSHSSLLRANTHIHTRPKILLFRDKHDIIRFSPDYHVIWHTKYAANKLLTMPFKVVDLHSGVQWRMQHIPLECEPMLEVMT